MSSLAGKRYVIVGLTRLTVRVSRLIVERGGDVTVVLADDGAADGSLAHRLPEGVGVIESHDVEAALDEAELAGSTCLLALADDDLANLSAAVACHAFHPEVPIVLRIYDMTKRDGIDYNLGYIETDFGKKKNDLFDPEYMKALFDYAYEKGRRRPAWHKTPPLLELPELPLDTRF